MNDNVFTKPGNISVIDMNSWMDDPIKADKWINIYFMKDGISDKGRLIFGSEEEARTAAISCVNGWNPDSEIEGFPSHYPKDFSHHIQMPVK